MKKFEQYQDHKARLYPELHPIKTAQNERVLSRTVTFQVTDACNLACFVAGTKILMSDFSYKNIEDIKVGDMVMAFDEFTKKGKQLKCGTRIFRDNLNVSQKATQEKTFILSCVGN